jgi:methylated-DNA-protein-cysteine methyltransferase related protein
MGSTSGKRQAVPNFYAAVYRLVAQIPCGQVATYGQIAHWLGHASAARAVGYALHALPSGSDIPWQRVINAAGRVSSRGDRHYEGIQRAILEAEGVRFDLYGSVDLRKFGWGGPLAGEYDRHDGTHQHQSTHQQEDHRHIPAPDTFRQTSRQHRA